MISPSNGNQFLLLEASHFLPESPNFPLVLVNQSAVHIGTISPNQKFLFKITLQSILSESLQILSLATLGQIYPCQRVLWKGYLHSLI